MGDESDSARAETATAASGLGGNRRAIELAQTAAPHEEETVRSPSAVEGSVESGRLQSGQAIGRYVIEERVGAGGMGVVYRAHDPELDRQVAIKLLHVGDRSSGAAASARARLLREAQALARLSHPNVISVYDAGTVGDDVFIAMEFVAGVTAREWLGERDRSSEEVVDVFVAAGRGLAAAHAAGMVHRDFKPENLLIGDDGRVLVLDFGLARAVGSTDAADSDVPIDTPRPSGRLSLDTPLTRAGELIGTPAYMAPEQHTQGTVGPAADQFSFCVSVYEALFGRRPFRGKSRQELVDEVSWGLAAEPPADADVPTALLDPVLRGLGREPTERHPSMDALLELMVPRIAAPPQALNRWLVAGTVGIAAITGAVALGLALRGAPASDPCAGGEARLEGICNGATVPMPKRGPRSSVRFGWPRRRGTTTWSAARC